MAKKKAKKRSAKKSSKGIDKTRWSVAGALVWGGAMLLLGLLATYASWGNAMVDVLGSVYLGFNATLAGALIGTAWGLIDMFIGVWILLWVYEKLGNLSA